LQDLWWIEGPLSNLNLNSWISSFFDKNIITSKKEAYKIFTMLIEACRCTAVYLFYNELAISFLL
jgi:hypothetical protein